MKAIFAAILSWVLNRFFAAPTPPVEPVVSKAKVDNAIRAHEIGAAVERDVASDDGLRDYAARDPNNRDNRH